MMSALIIVFREVIEAGLIVGIVLAATAGVPLRGRAVAFGVGGGRWKTIHRLIAWAPTMATRTRANTWAKSVPVPRSRRRSFTFARPWR